MMNCPWQRFCRLCCLAALLSLCVGRGAAAAPPWPRHTIDDSSRGADGVRLRDIDADGRPEIVTGWEEGGVIRIYHHPGPQQVKVRWPAVTVGRVSSAEDAVITDLDRDGIADVVSCCEGKTRKIFWHHAGAASDFWSPDSWSTEELSDPANAQAWMFSLPWPANVGRSHLIAGSKGTGASVSRLVVEEGESGVEQVLFQRLCDAGWIMSLRARDMDGDGDLDVLFSDRKGPLRGIGWLEQPANPDRDAWRRHVLGGTDEEVMFLDAGDLADRGVDSIVAATRSAGVIVLEHVPASGEWVEQMIPMPPGCGTGKGVAIADIDGDQTNDLVVSCENSAGKHGVFWLSRTSSGIAGDWNFHPISGADEGIKFDRLEVLDLDEDGDLDVLTCEERDNLGVIWYENPGN